MRTFNVEKLVQGMRSPALSINDSTQDFTGQIFSGIKDIETRNYPLPESIAGKWIPIVRTGKGMNVVPGYVKFSGCKQYTPDSFAADYERHRVQTGSVFDQHEYGWIIAAYRKLPTPIRIGSRGYQPGNYVFRDLAGIVDDLNSKGGVTV